jgi:hypothetical protein
LRFLHYSAIEFGTKEDNSGQDRTKRDKTGQPILRPMHLYIMHHEQI